MTRCVGVAGTLLSLAMWLAPGSAQAARCPPDAGLEQVRAAFGGARLAEIGSLRYRMQLRRAGQPDRWLEHQIAPRSGALRERSAVDLRWWDGATGWVQHAAGLAMLDASASRKLALASAYNFLSLLARPDVAAASAGAHRLRLTPPLGEAFTVDLDPANCLIRSNHFDDGSVGLEGDYRRLGGVAWPFRFELRKGDQRLVQGRFTRVAVHDDGIDPPRPAASARRDLPDTAAGQAVLVGNGWISGAKNDYNLSIAAHGRLLVFARSEAKFKQSRIYFARRADATEAWTAPEPVPFSDERFRDSDPWLSADGRWLYFVSDRPSDYAAAAAPPNRHLDIWRVAIDAGWGQPERLEGVNSEGYELGPEVHGDWLYFNSMRPLGAAAMSLWRARHIDGSRFTEPEPLPPPFNDGYMQGDLTFAPDGKTAVFWRQERAGGEADLYATRLGAAGWSVPVRLPAPLSGPGSDFTPAFAADGQALYFASERAFGAGEHPLLNGLANLYAVPVGVIDVALEAAAAAD